MKSPVLPIGLLLIAAALLYMAFEKPEGQIEFASKKKSYNPLQAEQMVNKNLFLTSKQMELMEQHRQAENANAPQVGEAIWPPIQKQEAKGVDHSADTYENQAVEDLRRNKEVNYLSPGNVIQAQIHDQQKSQEYEDTYKREYARQFVENARRNGYSVQLSEDYVVMSVKQLRKPNSVPIEEASKSEGKGSR